MTYLYADPEPSFLEQRSHSRVFESTFTETFSAAFAEGLHMTSVAGLYDLYRTDTRLDDDEDQIGEDLWKMSGYSRPGLKWYPGLTDRVAEILVERYEIKEQRDFILARGGALPTFAGFMAGGMLDPVNLIPFTGGLRGAKLLSAIGRGARNNAFIEVALTPLLAAQSGAFQEDFTAQMAATNILSAAGLGGVFAGMGNILGRISPTLRAMATQKAVVDTVNERPVDVSGYIGDRYDAAPYVQAELPRYLSVDDTPVMDAILTASSLRTADQITLVERLDIDADTMRAMEIAQIEPSARTADETAAFNEFMGRGFGVVKKLDARVLPEPERIAEEPEGEAKPGRLEEPDEAEIKQLDEQLGALEPERAPDAEPEVRPEIKAADEAAAADLKRAKAYEDAAICLSS